MIRALFVDDESAVVEGLENRLRSLRKRWDMTFAVGAAAATRTLAGPPFDVVVVGSLAQTSTSLLEHVQREHSATIRVVLTGSARDVMLRPIAHAHGIIGMPCDPSSVEEAVERATVLRGLVDDVDVRCALASIDRLPVLPDTFRRITALLDDPNVGATQVASEVEQDVAITTRLLQVVNSAYFGLQRPIMSAADAVCYLGVETVRSMVLSLGLFEALKSDQDGQGVSISKLQHHALEVANDARGLVLDPADAGAAHTAGMLHDIGYLVLATALADRLAAVQARAIETGENQLDAEREVLGFTHAKLGASLLGLWGLPTTIVEAVAYHHRAVVDQSNDIAVAVRRADTSGRDVNPPSPRVPTRSSKPAALGTKS